MEHESMKRVKRVAESMKDHRRDWEPHYQLLEKHFLPRRGLFHGDPGSQSMSDRGKLLNGSMLDGTPTRALRITQSGLQSGISSPSRPWFRMQTTDPDKMKRQSVKEFMFRAEREMRRMFSRSGIYNMLHTGYGDISVYGTEAAIIEDHGAHSLRALQLVPGTYWLGMSDDRTIDTLYREFAMTINQIVGKFVYKGQRFGDPDWSTVPNRIKTLFDKGELSVMETVCQLITPRLDRDHRRQDGPNKPIASEYWLKMDDRNESTRKLAAESGYDRNPISASRWNVNGHEVYGLSPAMETLPDVRELMAKRREYAELLKRVNRPAMNASADLRNSRFSLLPDSINFMADPAKGLVPAYQINPNFTPLKEDIEMSKDMIWSGMYADLFMMISQMDRRQITATEIDERREEKLIALGPVLERQHFEKHQPLVERGFERVLESGVLGPPPEELQDEEVEVDFVSMLAQAQKAIATGGMERFTGYVGNLAAVKPEVLDKFDEGAAVNEYADMLGIAPTIVRSDEDVDRIRAERQAVEQQMQQAEAAVQTTKAMQQGAGAAKLMSEADGPRGPAPTDVLAKTGLA